MTRKTANSVRRKSRASKRASGTTKRCWATWSMYGGLCLWSTRADAESNADDDERVFRVTVTIDREVTKRPRAYEGNPF